MNLYFNIFIPEDNILYKVKYTLRISVILAISSILFIIIIIFVISRVITKALNKSVHMIQNLGDGNFNIRLRMNQRDEIEKMAEAMAVLTHDIQSGINNINDIMATVAKGDLSRFVNVDFKVALNELKQS